MAVEIADDEPAAVEKHDQRPRRSLGARIEQPQRNRSRFPRCGEIANHGKFTDRQIGRVARRGIEGARGRRVERSHRRLVAGGEDVEQGPDVGSDKVWRVHHCLMRCAALARNPGFVERMTFRRLSLSDRRTLRLLLANSGPGF